MEIIRQIDVYDRITENLVEEIVVEYDLVKVKEIIRPSPDDPELYYQYTIEGTLQNYFEAIGLSFNQKQYLYFLCCYQGL